MQHVVGNGIAFPLIRNEPYHPQNECSATGLACSIQETVYSLNKGVKRRGGQQILRLRFKIISVDNYA